MSDPHPYIDLSDAAYRPVPGDVVRVTAVVDEVHANGTRVLLRAPSPEPGIRGRDIGTVRVEALEFVDGPPERVEVDLRPQLLTRAEHDLVHTLGVAYGMWCDIVGDGLSRAGDCTEFAAHVHDLQNAVLANAAARAYPDRYRLAGGETVVRGVVGP